ncbi:GNAT family N-acetyltransferase [Shewanella sedimentimangrovi]|uniref:GNAT family N-acetyltransferase n=1 Tax=Shewanella sedimentimangrovi TaxID=2814293 RepID=A0ABX7R0S9_9GAMM|nr:GNAT family N-acetyltransferase [Shewanella sedimentimangrovi]QSX37394.1 GNAT family N-acetyltransferase [Shewanella sedimentimangrovi]
MYQIHIQALEQLTPQLATQVAELMQQIPEFNKPATADELLTRLADKPCLLQWAFIEGELAGFKLGYALDEQHFYSWLGGILPDYRRLGLAQRLLESQEAWAKDKGYQQVSVKTLNRLAPMLGLLIRNRYQITALQSGMQLGDTKLSLQKSLSL